MSAETLQKVKVRKEKNIAVTNSRTRTSKAKAQKEYSNAHRIVEKSIKFDKLNYINKLAEETEEAAKNKYMKQLYDTRKLSNTPIQKDQSKINKATPSGQRWANSVDGMVDKVEVRK